MKVPVRAHKKARIEIIPLIDVIFFCLATFVLVTLSMNRNRIIPMDLPAGQTVEQPKDPDPPVKVTVQEGGDILWGREILPNAEQFRMRLREHKLGNPDPKILINGAERARFGEAVKLLDICRQEKVEKVSLVTQKQKI